MYVTSTEDSVTAIGIADGAHVAMVTYDETGAQTGSTNAPAAWISLKTRLVF